jgi:glycosyltransferase involved in cell wall biosynthesis
LTGLEKQLDIPWIFHANGQGTTPRGLVLMRITFVLPFASFGGGTRVVACHAEALGRLGHRVFVVSQPPEFPGLRAHLRSLVRQHRWLPRTRRGSHLDGAPIEHQVLSRARPVTDADLPEADVVIATWWETAEWVMRLSASKGAKAYFVQGHEVFDGLPIDRVRATYGMPLHKIVVSRWLADVMRAEYGDSAASLVMNGVDTGLFQTAERGRQSVRRVGMMYAEATCKGTDVGLRAFELLKARRPDTTLVVLSSHPPNPSLPLPPNVELHVRPNASEIPSIYASCDAWLVPSRSEGFGLPILEAMACRTPVVSTPIGAAPDLVSPDAGFLASAADPVELAHALERVLDLDDRAWRQMSKRAHQIASKHGWTDATKKFEQVLQNLVSGKLDPASHSGQQP